MNMTQQNQTEANQENRTLTDADAAAVAAALHKRIVKQLYLDLGKGVFSLIWKAIVAAIVLIAAYGAGKGVMTK